MVRRRPTKKCAFKAIGGMNMQNHVCVRLLCTHNARGLGTKAIDNVTRMFMAHVFASLCLSVVPYLRSFYHRRHALFQFLWTPVISNVWIDDTKPTSPLPLIDADSVISRESNFSSSKSHCPFDLINRHLRDEQQHNWIAADFIVASISSSLSHRMKSSTQVEKEKEKQQQMIVR